MTESENTGNEAVINENAQAQAEEPAPEIKESTEYADVEKEAYEDFNLPPVDVYSMLGSFIAMLGAQTWQWLGLIKNPTTGELNRDLAQARVAIDTMAYMASQIESKMSPQEQRELQAMLSDLRINFVQQSSK